MRYIINKLNNLRSLENYNTKDKKRLNNKIFRSNLPYNLDLETINDIHSLGITTIIDLRSEHEILKKPSSLNCDIFNYHNIILKGHIFPKTQKEIVNGYMDMVNDHESMKKILDIILNSHGSVLIHCNSGKDRTGIVCMILQLIMNCYEDDIIAEYSLSINYLREQMRNYHLENPKAPKFLGDTKYTYMEKTLDLFYKKYKNIEEYMRYLGVSADKIKDIKKIISK